VLSAAGAAPPYFTGLLPEGRRLNALRRSVKTSVDDELSLLIAAGANPVGDVQIVGHGEPLDPDEHAVELNPKAPVDFDALLGDSGLIDPVALAGVQDKLSAGMISMPVASAGRRYILKLNAPEFPHVVENELVMFRYAAKLRIPLSRVRLIRDVEGRPGLLVERFVRFVEQGKRSVQLDSLLALLETLGLELQLGTRTRSAARAIDGQLPEARP
jgi:serine/threonine-protein kinase HipA